MFSERATILTAKAASHWRATAKGSSFGWGCVLMVTSYARTMSGIGRQFDYLRGHGGADVRVIRLGHDDPACFGACRPRQTRSCRRASAAVAAAPASQPARSGARCRDLGAPSEFRGDRPGCAVARHGPQTGGAIGRAPA